MTKHSSDKPGTLMLRTRELLHDDNRDLLKIHKDTKIPFYWIRAFSAGQFNNPSVNRVQKLYEHLTSKPLQLI